MIRALVVLSFVSVLLRAYTNPYFPRQFDDAEYWLSSYQILDEWRAAGNILEKLHTLYLTRPVKPHPFPLLGVPFLAAGMHPSLATAIMNGVLFAALAWVSCRIFLSLKLTTSYSIFASLFLYSARPPEYGRYPASSLPVSGGKNGVWKVIRLSSPQVWRSRKSAHGLPIPKTWRRPCRLTILCS
ncbi:MAG: hypothetical protein HUU37_09735 [Bdellovibrionales bacterium]|nr:hypothetical protein [Bdellovibrionales bacterium]